MNCDNCNRDCTESFIRAGKWSFVGGLVMTENHFCSPECLKEYCVKGKRWFSRKEFVKTYEKKQHEKHSVGFDKD